MRFVHGIAAKFYRGIGPEIQMISPFSEMNIFIGANNSGKSIILNLLSQQISRTPPATSGNRLLQPAELYRGSQTGEFFLALGSRPEDILIKFKKSLEQSPHINIGIIQKPFENLLELISRNGLIWTCGHPQTELFIPDSPSIPEMERWPIQWYQLWGNLTNQANGSAIQHWIPETLAFIARIATPAVPKVRLIPAKRQVSAKGEAFEDLSGRGLIDHLAALQSPSFQQQDDREKFNKINLFLREITGNTGARLEIPHDREHILVHLDSKVLPLSSFGTGIHEVILIASFCTIHDGSVLCIEEPEIHLHPLLQRKLISYLSTKTTSQYFIATHSSAFIDSEKSSVFRVWNDGSQTYVTSVITKDDHRSIIDELGVQASDILQSNSVIWVEGPSDRIYLNHWISAVDERLVEGIHYTIMFYGGSLISHLSASDEALSEFIRLRDLNRNMAIIIDSDRSSPEDELKPHAKRIQKEMVGGSGLLWITEGREVENYVPGDRLQSALRNIHSKIYKSAGKVGPYDHAFYFHRDDPTRPGRQITNKTGDKVGAAALVCKDPAVLDILDLRQQIEKVVGMLRTANGLK